MKIEFECPLDLPLYPHIMLFSHLMTCYNTTPLVSFLQHHGPESRTARNAQTYIQWVFRARILSRCAPGKFHSRTELPQRLWALIGQFKEVVVSVSWPMKLDLTRLRKHSSHFISSGIPEDRVKSVRAWRALMGHFCCKGVIAPYCNEFMCVGVYWKYMRSIVTRTFVLCTDGTDSSRETR